HQRTAFYPRCPTHRAHYSFPTRRSSDLRLVTTILDPLRAPAEELAALYHERWEIENTFDELKTHLRGRQIVLRSKTPELVRQEFYGFLLAHFAVRQRSEEHTSELQSRGHLVCRLLLEKKNKHDKKYK